MNAPLDTTGLVAIAGEMDRRAAQISIIGNAAALPRIVVVLEDLGGICQASEATDGASKSARALIRRVIAQGRKVGIQLTAHSTRPETEVIVDASRANTPVRPSFRIA